MCLLAPSYGYTAGEVVGLAGGIGEDEDRRGEADVRGPGLRHRGPAVADDGEVGAGLLELACVRPQLGRLLAAEGSAVVAEEDQDGGAGAPEELLESVHGVHASLPWSGSMGIASTRPSAWPQKVVIYSSRSGFRMRNRIEIPTNRATKRFSNAPSAILLLERREAASPAHPFRW